MKSRDIGKQRQEGDKDKNSTFKQDSEDCRERQRY